MEIVKTSITDLNALRNLEKTCFPLDAWPLLDLVAVLSFPGVVRLKAVENGEMIGFVAAETRPHENADWIATLCVHPAYQRRGIGSQLLEACESQLSMPSIRLCVRANNNAAIHMYQRAGYLFIDTWWKYYRDGADALIMEKRLRQPSYEPYRL